MIFSFLLSLVTVVLQTPHASAGVGDWGEKRVFVLEKMISSGRHKSAYTLTNRPNQIALQIKDKSLSVKEKRLELLTELNHLKQLKALGVRVVDFEPKLININREPSIVMRKYEANLKDDPRAFFKLFNEQSLKDVFAIQNRLNETGKTVHDLQLLIDKNSRVYIADPKNIENMKGIDRERQDVIRMVRVRFKYNRFPAIRTYPLETIVSPWRRYDNVYKRDKSLKKRQKTVVKRR